MDMEPDPLGIWQGSLRQRCKVKGPAPAGMIDMGKQASYLAPNTYTAADTHLFAADEIGTEGEFDLYCSVDSGVGIHCPENMYCDTTTENPHFGYAGFDDFGQAFILQFQVQTLSTWYEYGYASAAAKGWYTQFYYVAIITIVGFVVAHLFISVVCFGFESLAEQLEKPIFSAIILPSNPEALRRHNQPRP